MGSSEKMGVWVTRPITDALLLGRKIQHIGCVPYLQPLLRIQPVTQSLAAMDGMVFPKEQHFIFTSATAVKIFAEHSAFREATAWCVGDKTALMARGLGFSRIIQGDGNGLALKAMIIKEELDEAFIHFSGEDVTVDFEHELPSCQRIILYQTVPATHLRPRIAQALEEKKVHAVLVYSKKTAMVLQSLVTLPRHVTVIALSDVIGNMFPDHRVIVAPSETDVLKTLNVLVETV